MSRQTSACLAVLMAVLICACSKAPQPESQSSSTTPSTSASAAAAAAANGVAPGIELQAFGKLDRFKGKPPDDLVKDAVIGNVIRSIVPQSQFKCMDDVFNYLRDLDLNPDGSVSASANGSHADNFQEAYLSVSPSGSVNLVLNCEPQANPKGKYLFFSNDGNSAKASKAVLQWLYEVGRAEDRVVRSDGKSVEEMGVGELVQAVAPKNQPVEVTTNSQEANAGQGASQSPVFGTWQCKSLMDGQEAQTFFLIRPDGLISYRIGNSLQMTGYDFSLTGNQASATMTEIIRNGRSANAQIPASFEFKLVQAARIDFKFTMTTNQRAEQMVRCLPLPV